MISLTQIGATHNFIDAQFVAKRGLQTKEHSGYRVMVDNSDKLLCTQKISNLHIRFGDGYELEDELYAVDIGDYDFILNVVWMALLVEFTLNLEKLEMKFHHEGRIVVLRGLLDVSCRVMQGHPRVKAINSNLGFGQDLLPGVITFDSDVGFG